MTAMITAGQKAPNFGLPDHLGRTITLDQFAGKRNVMLLYYPLDFTPT
jgi:peroxiredoxin